MILETLLVLAATAAIDEKEADDALDRFKQGIRNPSPTARATAVSELCRSPHEKTFKIAVGYLSSDVPEVRVAAAKGMAAFTDYKKIVCPMLLAALSSNAKEHDVRAAIFFAMGKLNDDMFLSEVVKAFRDDRVSVAKAALTAAADMRRKEHIDPMIELGKDIEKWLKNKQSGGYRDDKGQQGDESAVKARIEDLNKHLIKCLQSLTTEKWATFKEWEIWWGKRRATFEVPPPPPPPKKK